MSLFLFLHSFTPLVPRASLARAAMAHVKACLLGVSAVGKTSLVIQLTAQHFVEDYDPTIEDSYRKRLVVDNEPLLLEVLDTSGRDEYTTLRQQWIAESDAFMFVYSIVHPRSLAAIDAEVQQAVRMKGGPIVCSLVGNKADLEEERQVSEQEGQAKARSLQDAGFSDGVVGFFETSARVRQNVEEAFYDLIRRVRAPRRPGVAAGAPRGQRDRKCIVN